MGGRKYMDDFEIRLDNVLKAAWPYLIFPEDVFRCRLAGRVHAMFRNFLGRSETFYEDADLVMRTIETRPQYDSDRENLIYSFDKRVFTFYEHVAIQKRQIADIQRRLAKVEGPVKRGPAKRKGPKAKDVPETPNIEPAPPVEPAPLSRGWRSAEHPCPNCGAPLRKDYHSFETLHRLYCRVSTGGCGKKYTLEEDGTLKLGNWPGRGAAKRVGK